MAYSYNEDIVGQLIMVMVTGLTNFAMVPTLIILYKQKKHYEFVYGVFTLICSFTYHFLDSINSSGFIMTIDQWHILDNIGSIACVCSLFIALMKVDDEFQNNNLKQLSSVLAIVFQQYHPWMIETTIIPLIVFLIIFIVRCIYLRKITFHEYEQNHHMKSSILWLILAILCFSKGLDEHNDTYRFFHGLWHMNISFFSFKLFQGTNQTSESLSYTDFIYLNIPKIKDTQLVISDKNKFV